jgi:hypothetical protein
MHDGLSGLSVSRFVSVISHDNLKSIALYTGSLYLNTQSPTSLPVVFALEKQLKKITIYNNMAVTVNNILCGM